MNIYKELEKYLKEMGRDTRIYVENDYFYEFVKDFFHNTDAIIMDKWDNDTCPVVIGHPKGPFSYAIIDGVVHYPPVTRLKVSPLGELPKNPLNPPLVIKKYNNFFVIRDDLLPGGTKQRAILPFIDSMGNHKIIAYAGPSSGAAQCALGQYAKYRGVEAHMFYRGRITAFTERAKKMGVIMHDCNDNYKFQEMASEWCKKRGALLMPFGFEDANFRKFLSQSIRSILPNIKPKKIWMVTGSAVLLNSLYEVFPESYFVIVQVGYSVWWDKIKPERTRIIVHPLRFKEATTILPPYPSSNTYDGKVWEFVMREALPGDYVWNVAG